MKLETYLKTVGCNAIKNQKQDGSFPSGFNGPHNDEETPVRNTSHYLILLSYLHDRYEEERYLHAIKKTVPYLQSKEARPYNFTFHHRNSEVKDSCNGIVGQAWTIEAIAEVGRFLDIPELIDIAEEVFLLHPFNEKLGLWKRVEIDGKVLCFDSTYNHQIWFASAGALLSLYHDVDPKIKEQTKKFLDKTEKHLKTDDDGLIRGLELDINEYIYAALADNRARLPIVHLASNFPLKDSKLMRKILRNYTPISRLPRKSKESFMASIGYHSFHLYGLALLKKAYPNHQLWEKNWFIETLNLLREENFIDNLWRSKYGYPYNVSGIEFAYVLDEFSDKLNYDPKSQQMFWLTKQFEKCWDSKKQQMAKNNSDPTTLTARIYEAVRISNWDLEINI